MSTSPPHQPTPPSPPSPPQWPHLAGHITESGEHVLPVRVYYEDTDAGGVVYHARYLHFCERARSDWLRLLGIHHGTLTADDGRALYFVVRRMNCDFLRPARLNDVLEIRSRFLRASRVRLEAWQEVRLLSSADADVGSDAKNNARGHAGDVASPQTGPIFTAQVMVAVIDDSGRPARLPDWAMQKLEELRPGGADGTSQNG